MHKGHLKTWGWNNNSGEVTKVNEIDALRLTSQLLTAFQAVQSAIQQNESDIIYYEHEYNDLTHALELTKFNAAEGYQLAVQLKENRLNRRKANRIGCIQQGQERICRMLLAEPSKNRLHNRGNVDERTT